MRGINSRRMIRTKERIPYPPALPLIDQSLARTYERSLSPNKGRRGG